MYISLYMGFWSCGLVGTGLIVSRRMRWPSVSNFAIKLCERAKSWLLQTRSRSKSGCHFTAAAPSKMPRDFKLEVNKFRFCRRSESTVKFGFKFASEAEHQCSACNSVAATPLCKRCSRGQHALCWRRSCSLHVGLVFSYY